jgi:hypothetical protein
MNKHQRKMEEIDKVVAADMTFGQIDTPHSLEKLWKSQYRGQLIQDYFIEEQRRATNTMKLLTIVILILTMTQTYFVCSSNHSGASEKCSKSQVQTEPTSQMDHR